MSYFFDLEDYTSCKPNVDKILKQIGNEIKINKELYYQQNGTYEGYTPKQKTLFLDSNGDIEIYIKNAISGIYEPFNLGNVCCVDNMLYVLDVCKNKFGLFKDIDITQFFWDSNNQTCRWKPLGEVCAIDNYKIALNPVFNDGAIFNVNENDKNCGLTIDFNYLFKFDCNTLSNLLTNPSIDTNLSNSIKETEEELAKLKTECETTYDNIVSLINEYNNTSYSLENEGLYYCINEDNDGLTQLQNLLGPLKYKKFINGELESYNNTDFINFSSLNTESIVKNNKELMSECDTPYGTKSNLKQQIDYLTTEHEKCEAKIIELEATLAQNNLAKTTFIDCSNPTYALETFNVSVTLDVVESDGSLKTITEINLFDTIGVGNLYSYLVDKQDESGFYFCSLPKENETWTSGCTSLIAYELTAPNGTQNTEDDLNVSTCKTVKDLLLGDLLLESPFGSSENDIKAFNNTLNKKSFASNWLQFYSVIDDEEIINQIKNKKVKLSIKINNSCTNVCVYIDNIKLTKECVVGEKKTITITKSPGFELEKVIDNKKSWVDNTIRVNRNFEIENINNLTVFRNTDYDINDERLVINSKEIDLNINIASAIENDVQCFINDNTNLFDTTPTTECGCTLKCFEDVFDIIQYSDAVDSGLIPAQIDPEDLMSTARTIRDAWIKSWNELVLATAPYLDIKNGIYHPNPSEDVLITYKATREAWLKALNEFNKISGGGFIEGLTFDEQLGNEEIENYVLENFNNYEKIVPQIFNTECGRIYKRNNGEGYMYLVETPTNELRVFLAFEDFAPRNTTWIEITSLVQEDYAPNWNYGAPTITPEKASFYCKNITPKNYTTWLNMMSFHYQTNNNTSHDEWVNSVDNDFFIEWDSVKGKCVTKKFKEVVPENFSMLYPIKSLNYRTNYATVFIDSPQCDLDIYLRNSGSTSCVGVDFSWPNISIDIATLNREYRDNLLRISNEIFLTERTPLFNVYVIDPTTNMLPDETTGFTAVKVTTTIRKGSVDGEIVFKEEYVLNDSTSVCSFRQPSSYGLKNLRVYVGITDPNSAYWNPIASQWDYINGCVSSEFGTYITGSTSTLPLAGASDNGIDRNWSFDDNYYVHFDVINNDTSYVYEVTNNDFNLKDRTLPIVCPTSASTQTFNITTALNSINNFQTTILGQIQEDLDYALNNCTNC